MENKVTLFHSSLEGGKTTVNLEQIAVILKDCIDGCERNVFFNTDGNGKLSGPAVFMFAVRKAKDILLEGCEYQGMELQIETGGKKLPKLPSMNELKRLVEMPDCIIYINGSPYKPSTEVFGFQQVYDDCVKCIDALKYLGIKQDAMSIFATPEEISLEVHQDILGLMSGENLPEMYYRLLCHVCGIREVNGLPTKTDIKTVVLQTCDKNFKILLPGSNHPTLHRTKVGVGPSHFAYGIAAFSDYCGKKRTQQECQQEALNWLKFLEKTFEPAEGIKEKIQAMSLIPMPGAANGAVRVSSSGNANIGSNFQSLKTELDSVAASFASPAKSFKTFSFGLDKSLGGGWKAGGVHVILGENESGKAAFIMQQALISEKDMPVLCISYEHSLREFVTRAASTLGNINMSDMLSVLTVAGGPGDFARKSFSGAVEKFHAQISQNMYFLGTDSEIEKFEPETVQQLAAMMPGEGHKMVLIDSLQMCDFGDDLMATMAKLRNVASQNNLTILLSVHIDTKPIKRPHIIEEEDFTYLKLFQRFASSIIVLQTEKTNLRRFVTIVKGQVDQTLLTNLEQKASQAAGNKRYKSDAFTFIRVIHSVNGRRELIIYLYQPDIVKFFELGSLSMGRQ